LPKARGRALKKIQRTPIKGTRRKNFPYPNKSAAPPAEFTFAIERPKPEARSPKPEARSPKDYVRFFLFVKGCFTQNTASLFPAPPKL